MAASALAGSILCAAAFGQPARLPAPAAGARLEQGSEQAITWELEPPDREIDEMELVLSLDGGRTFPVRVTRRIDPAARTWMWTVPGLPAEHALLALRVGSDTSPGQERVVLVSAEFAVVADPRLGPEVIFWVDGEARTRDALDAPPQPSLPSRVFRAALAPARIKDSVDEPTQRTHHGFEWLRSCASGELPRTPAKSAGAHASLAPARASIRLPLRL